MTYALAFEIDTAEKIETIVNAYLRTQATSGRFGDIEPAGNWFSVRADGVRAMVSRGPLHWHVRIPSKDVVGVDADLMTAAQMALEA